MLQQTDARPVRVCEEVRGALRARIVVVRDDGRGGIAVLREVRINRNDDDARRARLTQHLAHACGIHGVDEEDAHTFRDEVTDLLNLSVGIEGGIARDEDIAVVLDHSADFLVDDFVEGVVRRHVDRAELRAPFILTRGVIRAGELGAQESREQHNECNPPSP